jgi:hypothetical protein
MTQEITLEEALKLVDFDYIRGRGWRVGSVKGNVVDVHGDVGGDVGGHVYGKINGRKWYFAETPKEKLKRLIDEGADREQLIEAVNQLKDN